MDVLYTSAYVPCLSMKNFTFSQEPSCKTTGQVLRLFRKRILTFYRKNRRLLPWRETQTPWHILVSEVMLQQTQVERVIPKFKEFIKAFPDPSSLAAAPLRTVLAVWSGLGYNRRALTLKQCARTLCSQFGGEVPDDYEKLLSLPGIGPSTAASICVFSFNQPRVFIETNIRAVYIHLFFPGRQNVADRELLPLIKATLDTRDPRTWYNALMDYGAFLKKRFSNPSRRSAHHTRQSPFAGSDREIRGRILKMLLANAPCTEASLIRSIKRDPERVRLIMQQLILEGFIKKTGRRLSLLEE